MKAVLSSLFLISISLLILGCAHGETQASSEIFLLIEKAQPINYNNMVIDGDLIFGKKIVNSEINIKNCTIKGAVDFRGATFKKPVYLVDNKFKGILLADESTQFSERVTFLNSEFNDIIYFNFATFNDFASFKNSSFKDANFNNVNFNKDANFIDCAFKGNSYFDNVIFSGDVDFQKCRFNGIARFEASGFKKGASFLDLISKYITFRNAKFDGKADFTNSTFDNSIWGNCNFKESAIFNDVEFKDTAFFRDTNFEGTADFENSDFWGDVVFKGCIFNRSAYFGLSKFHQSADFSGAKFKESAEFLRVPFQGLVSNFNETQFNGDVSFEDATFSGCLYLTKTKFNKMYIRWNNINKLGYDDAAYMALLENFKKLGMLDDADSCYYEYRKEHRYQNWTSTVQTGMLGTLDQPFRKTIDYFLDKLYAYGVDPLRPIMYSVIIIFLCAFLWWIVGLGKLFDRNGEKIKKYSVVLSFKDPLIFSFLVFISAAKFLIETPMVKIPQPIEIATPWSRYIFFFEKIFAGLLLALFFVAVSRTIVRNA